MGISRGEAREKFTLVQRQRDRPPLYSRVHYFGILIDSNSGTRVMEGVYPEGQGDHSFEPSIHPTERRSPEKTEAAAARLAEGVLSPGWRKTDRLTEAVVVLPVAQ